MNGRRGTIRHIVITVFLIISSFASPCRSMNTLPAHLFTLSLPKPLDSALHKNDINGWSSSSNRDTCRVRGSNSSLDRFVAKLWFLFDQATSQPVWNGKQSIDCNPGRQWNTNHDPNHPTLTKTLFSQTLFLPNHFCFPFFIVFTPGHLQRRVWVLRNDQRVQNIGWKIKRTRHRQSFDVRQRRIEHLESCLLCPEPCFKSQVSYARPKQQQKTLQKPRWRGLDNGTGRVLHQMVELLLSTDRMLSARYEIVGRKHGRRYR